MAISRRSVSELPPFALEIWRQINGATSWQLEGFDADCDDLLTDCTPIYQDARDAIVTGMRNAWVELSRGLGYYPAAVDVVSVHTLGSSTHHRDAMQFPSKRVNSYGKTTYSEESAGEGVSYDKTNEGLGHNDTATIDVTTTVAIADLQLRFQLVDCPNGWEAERYLEIHPFNAVEANGVVTFTLHPANLVKPTKQFEGKLIDLDLDVADNFVGKVDVYKRVVDPLIPAELFEADGTTLIETVLVYPQNDLLGTFIMPTFSTAFTSTRLKVYANAGFPLTNGEMDAGHAEALVRLANTLMTRYPNGLSGTPYQNMEMDRARLEQEFTLGFDRFGNQEGAVHAARLVHRMRQRTWVVP